MLRLSKIEKYFGDRQIFNDVSLNFGRGVKAGLVGPNGSGKSTLFKIVADMLEADSGYISRTGVKIVYLPQQMENIVDVRVGDFLLPAVFAALLELELRAKELDTEPLSSAKQQIYSEALNALVELDGYAMQSKAERILDDLKLQDVDWLRLLDTLSGGERSRIGLARALIHECDVLLLDEPTNNLDLESLKWLEREISNLDCGVLVISHDREFLDNITSRTYEIDSTNGNLSEYGGNYSWYKTRKAQEFDRQLREFNEHQTRVKKLKADVEATKQQSLATEYTTVNDYLRGRSKKVAAKAKARETRLNKMLSDEHRCEKPREQDHMRLKLQGRELYDRLLFQATDVSFQIDDKSVLCHIDLSLVGSSKVLIRGNNGAGKTTLLRLLLGELEPTCGSLYRCSGITTGYLPQFIEFANEEACLLEFIEESISKTRSENPHQKSPASKRLSSGHSRTFLHRFGFSGNQVFQQLGKLSQGERKRALLAKFMALDVDVLVLDEPTNHLDFDAMETLENALATYRGAVIAVTHDRRFAQNLKPETIWHLDGGGIIISGAYH